MPIRVDNVRAVRNGDETITVEIAGRDEAGAEVVLELVCTGDKAAMLHERVGVWLTPEDWKALRPPHKLGAGLKRTA